MEISTISTPTVPTPIETFLPKPCLVSEPILPEPAVSEIVEPVHIREEEITVINPKKIKLINKEIIHHNQIN
jgi:hypothetical protein